MRYRLLLIAMLAAISLPLSAHEGSAHDDHSERRAARRQADSIFRSKFKADEQNLHGMLRDYLDHQPSFAMYHDNYFITGVPTDRRIDKYSADAKFQISVRQILFRNILPRNNILALTYTQKSFWDIYRKSSPFAENNYNPSINISRPIVLDGKMSGAISLGLEHESNGRDSIWSRSRNFFTFSGSWLFTDNVSMQVKFWPGWPSSDNHDLYDYKGWGLFALNYCSPGEKLILSCVVSPRGFFRAFNTQLEANIKVWDTANQFLFIQWHQGYAESLIEYNRYSSMVRVGICIKPKNRRFIPIY